jgi:hypothetical protein
MTRQQPRLHALAGFLLIQSANASGDIRILYGFALGIVVQLVALIWLLAAARGHRLLLAGAYLAVAAITWLVVLTSNSDQLSLGVATAILLAPAALVLVYLLRQPRS